jgi:hypothetical protein
MQEWRQGGEGPGKRARLELEWRRKDEGMRLRMLEEQEQLSNPVCNRTLPIRKEVHLGRDTELCPGPGGPQVFSLVIFSSLLTDGYQNKTESSQLYCVLKGNSTACSFAVGAGFLAFLSCLVFLTLDAHESRIASTRFKTAFQLLDFIVAGEPWRPCMELPLLPTALPRAHRTWSLATQRPLSLTVLGHQSQSD